MLTNDGESRLFYMVYNGDSDNQDLVSLCNDMVNTDAVSYPIKNKTRAANKWLKTFWLWIFEAYGGWLYDDSNNTTDFPSATTTLNANQKDYGLPSTSLIVRGVQVKTSGGVWQKLLPMTEEQINDVMAEPQFMITASQPRYYVPYAGSIKIYPASNYTQSASLRVSFGRGGTYFASTDTGVSPGFIAEFHEGIATGMAYEFARNKRLPQMKDLMEDLVGVNGFKQRVQDYYSSRFAELFPARITVRDMVRENQ